MIAVPGYRPSSTSRLLVPEAISREREVWTYDEYKALERALKFVEGKGLKMFFGCPDARCTRQPIETHRNADGGLTLRCQHKDRVIVKAI
jgi:hypothetical protein